MNAEEVKKMLRYDPETGKFTWLVSRGKARVGAEAGSFMKIGYITIGLFGTNYYAHRLAFLFMTGEWPKGEVDHIDRRRAHNAWENLRDTCRSTNMLNTDAKGYGFDKRQGKYRAYIKVNYKYVHLGYFDTEPEARKAYLDERERMGLLPVRRDDEPIPIPRQEQIRALLAERKTERTGPGGKNI